MAIWRITLWNVIWVYEECNNVECIYVEQRFTERIF